MKSVLFLIPTLDRGGAENVLVDLVNRLDQNKFKITVQTLFDKNSQKDRLAEAIEYRSFLYKQFRGNSRLQALVPAGLLYRLIVGKRYDIVVSYLEGPTTHIASGCPYKDTKKVGWIHVEMEKDRQFSVGFNSKKAADKAYRSFDKVIFVARTVKKRFEELAGHSFENGCVIYNVLDTQRIRELAEEPLTDFHFEKDTLNIVTVGRLVQAKGYDRLVRIHKKLHEDGYSCHIYVIGAGQQEAELKKYLDENGLSDSFTLVGFRENPYKYVAKADLFVCSSRREGISTAVSEALVLGIPVVSTECSGAEELLGKNEYGLITDNDEEALYQGIKRLVDNRELLSHYKKMAAIRGKAFNEQNTVKAVEDMLLDLQ